MLQSEVLNCEMARQGVNIPQYEGEDITENTSQKEGSSPGTSPIYHQAGEHKSYTYGHTEDNVYLESTATIAKVEYEGLRQAMPYGSYQQSNPSTRGMTGGGYYQNGDYGIDYPAYGGYPALEQGTNSASAAGMGYQNQPRTASAGQMSQQAGYQPSSASQAGIILCNRDLWSKFHSFTTEMIITKQGRYVQKYVFIYLPNITDLSNIT